MSRHVWPVRIYYEDTDFSGAVYHANYLRFLERGRTEFLRAMGIDQTDLWQAGAGIGFVVRHMEVDFLKPARMDDVLEIETTVAEIGGASMLLDQRIVRGVELLIVAAVKIAVVGKGRVQRLPLAIREKFLVLT